MSENLSCRQGDVLGAFTLVELDKDTLYMKQPPGAHNGAEGDELRLQRPLYGLK